MCAAEANLLYHPSLIHENESLIPMNLSKVKKLEHQLPDYMIRAPAAHFDTLTGLLLEQ